MVCPAPLMGVSTSTVRTSSPSASTSVPAWTAWWAARLSVLTRCPCPVSCAQSQGWSSLRGVAVRNGCVMMTTTSARSCRSRRHFPPSQTANITPTTSVPFCSLNPCLPHSEVHIPAALSCSFSDAYWRRTLCVRNLNLVNSQNPSLAAEIHCYTVLSLSQNWCPPCRRCCLNHVVSCRPPSGPRALLHVGWAFPAEWLIITRTVDCLEKPGCVRSKSVSFSFLWSKRYCPNKRKYHCLKLNSVNSQQDLHFQTIWERKTNDWMVESLGRGT